MTTMTAAQLIVRSLLQRIVPGEHGLFVLSGPITPCELDALRQLVGQSEIRDSDAGSHSSSPVAVILDRTLLEKEPTAEGLVCFDFGTAASKVAIDLDEGPTPLAIGARAGDPASNAIFLSPSTLALHEGRLIFGWRAEQAAETDPSVPLVRSLKSTLWGSPDRINELALSAFGHGFTNRDLLILYLSYLSRLVSTELEELGQDPHLMRRYAMPFAYDDQHEQIRFEFGRLLGQAAILADSLGDRLLEGVEPDLARGALDAVENVEPPAWLLGSPPCVGEPVAAGNFAMAREPGDRTLYMIVDIGAGTTDVCVMALRERFGESEPITIPGGALSVEFAGDHLDDLLAGHLSETQAPGLADVILRRKRELKERLFRDGVISVDLDDVPLYLTKDDFLLTREWAHFVDSLRSALGRCVDALDHGYRNTWGNGAIRVAITGGGSFLPLGELQSGRIGDCNVALQAVDALPEELQARYFEIRNELPRLVVCLGGVSEALPEPLDQRQSPRDPASPGTRRFAPLNKSADGLQEATITL